MFKDFIKYLGEEEAPFTFSFSFLEYEGGFGKVATL
jgi:hypothetical protein